MTRSKKVALLGLYSFSDLVTNFGVAEIKFDINVRKRVYVTFECCGSRVPHIVVFAPTTYLAYLRLARVIIDTTRAHCEIQIKKQKGLEDVAQLDSDNENSLKSHQNFRDRFAEDNEKVGRYYPYDLLDGECFNT